MTGSTFELGLTRLWYLAGDWEGTGGGEDFSVQAQARFEWALDDHFIAGFSEMRDSGSGQVLNTEHVYIYYDRSEDGVVGLFFANDGTVERAVGRVDTVGHLVMTSSSISCVPPSLPRTRLRREIQLITQDRWIYTIEMDSGKGLLPFVTIEMQRKLPLDKGGGKK